MFLRLTTALFALAGLAFPATLGTVVPVLGGASDIVLDQSRGRVYLVNTTKNQVEIYSIQQRRLLSPVSTGGTPIAAAISRSGKYLYVTSQDQSSINTIDLDTLNIIKTVTLPAKPEGIAVGGDERVLVTTIGSGTGNSQNVLMIYDPGVDDPAAALAAVPMAPAPPQSPQLPPPTGKVAQTSRGNLAASADGNYIIGANVPANNFRVVFVYEVSSGTVLRSRLVANSSGVLAVAPDGSKFMSGSTLFDATTLQILAQENLANAPYMVQPGTQFNIEMNQGGSTFAPDGSVLYAGFDIAPQTNPPTRADVSQLMLNDPDNLLIQTAFQLPENLSGKMVISSDGNSIYALSESGLTVVPIGNAFQSAVAAVDNNVTVLKNDQCGVTSGQNTSRVTVSNIGKGRMTATAQVLQLTPVGPAGLGGFGPGGGIIGGGVVIILPPVIIGGPTGGPGPVIPGGPPNGTASNASIFQTAPPVAVRQTGSGATLDFSFNVTAARALGTISPSHDFVVQSPEAVNIPPRVRVYQNNRNAEAIGDIIPIPVGISANEALEDMVYDSVRQRLYISNSGMNRVEVFDIRQKQLLAPIKVGQLPHAMALSPDGSTLYVGNTGGESISIVDPDRMQTVGRVKFPPFPLFANLPLATPTNMAAGLSGPLFIMNSSNATGTVNNGSIWQVIGDTAVPRRASEVIGTTNGVPKQILGPRSMASTPGGEFVLIAGADGFAYLYDALADDFVQARQLTTFNQAQGYFGPVTAGPRGQYYVVNGDILNSALTPLNGITSGRGGTPSRPVAAVSAASNTMYARFTQPIRANTTTLATDAGQIELIDANTGNMMRSVPALEGPMSQATTNARATAVEARTMAIDSSGSAAYVLTTSGLSIIPLDLPNPADRPLVNPKGAVNLASYQTAVAPNGLLSIFGKNLAASETAASAPLPTKMGGVCVTLNNTALPLFMTSAGQINAQIPPDLATGNYSLSVRAIGKNVASAAQPVTVSKYAPAVFADTATSQALIVHDDGSLVTKDHPAKRDEHMTMYASGLGPTTGGKVTAGNPSPSSPLAVIDPATVKLYFGNPSFSQAGIIVDWAGLAPGFVGLYQLNIRVPGDHLKGDALPITLKVGNVSSPSTGPVVPTVAVE